MSSGKYDESSVMTTAQRLHQALALMVEDGDTPTASALCESVGISRNALYRYHHNIVEALRELKRRRRIEPSGVNVKLQKLECDNAALRLQVAQLASLVDHYFSAWQESESLLKRRESELSNLKKSTVLSLRG